jgi:hypothetical protein
MPSRQCLKFRAAGSSFNDGWLFSIHLDDGSRIKITQPPMGNHEGSRSVEPVWCEEETTKWASLGSDEKEKDLPPSSGRALRPAPQQHLAHPDSVGPVDSGIGRSTS